MARKSVHLSHFGQYLSEKGAQRRDVAKGLDITLSYVSMLCRESATPGLKLALRIAEWTRVTYGDEFSVGRWA